MISDIRDAWSDILSTSDDSNTRTAAVLATPEGEVVLASANTLTTGVESTPENTTRPGKKPWIDHAERNVIYGAAREGISTEGMHMHLKWFPCAECARAIVQSGIAVLHCDAQPEQNEKYRFEEAGGILAAAGVELRQQMLDSPVREQEESGFSI